MEVQTLINYALWICYGISVFGCFLVFFETSVPGPQKWTSVNTFSVLMVVNTLIQLLRTDFLPLSVHGPIRSLATLLLLFELDTSICAAATWFQDFTEVDSTGETANAVRTLRAGGVITFLGTFPLVFASYVLPAKGIVRSGVVTANFKQPRNIAIVIAAMFWLLSQCVSWGVKDACTTTLSVFSKQNPVAGAFNEASPFSQSDLLIMVAFMLPSVVFSDHEGLDLTVLWATRYIVTPGLVFPESLSNQLTGNQAAFPSLWKTVVTLRWMGAWVLLLGTLASSWTSGRTPAEQAVPISTRITNPRMIALAFLSIIGLSGAACTWSRAYSKYYTSSSAVTELMWQQNAYAAGFAILVPMLCAVSFLASWKGANIVAMFIAVNAFQACNGLQSYALAGAMMQNLVLFAAPILVVSESVAIGAAAEYFNDERRNASLVALAFTTVGMMYYPAGGVNAWLTLMFVGVIYFVSTMTQQKDAVKFVYYVVIYMLTTALFWPFFNASWTPTQANTVSASALMLYFAAFYALSFKGTLFQTLGSNLEGAATASLSAPLFGNDAAHGEDGGPRSGYEPVPDTTHDASLASRGAADSGDMTGPSTSSVKEL